MSQETVRAAWPPEESLDEAAPRVLIRVENGVGYLVLNRAMKRNALDAATRKALTEQLDAWRDDDAVRVIVLTGSGKTFAAGADLAELVARTPDAQRAFITPPHIYSAVSDWPGPIIACLNGHALGAGCELMMACDVRIAGDRAKVGQPEIDLGIIPGGGGTQRLPRLVGGRAMYLILSGEVLDAATAERYGLVDEVVAQGELHAHVQRFAERLATKNPAALSAAKDAVRAAWELNLDEGLRYEIDRFIEVFSEDGAKDRIRGYLEQRAGAKRR